MDKKMYSNKEVEDFIDVEGLEGAVLEVVPYQMIKDEKLAEAWKKAHEGLMTILEIFDML